MLDLSARTAVARMAAGDFTAEAYAEALLAQCARQKALNAFITLEPERVREAAAAADRRRAAGERVGALHGLPIPIKDSVDTAGLPTTAGTRALASFRPKADAPCVARLKAAGAIVLGKTNLHELSFGWTSDNLAFGAVHNPYDPTRIPGGSSGGTAAAVAAHMAPLGVAEDTQGSIRVPAALCGICGFRPTTGRYPSQGVAPITPVFDQVGPHARAVDDLALFDAVMTADERPIPAAALEGVRLGVAREYYWSGLDPEVETVARAAMARLEGAGVRFVEVELPDLADLVAKTTAAIQAHDAAPAFRRWLADSGSPVSLEQVMAQLSPDVKAVWERFVLPGAPMRPSEAAYAAARDIHRPAMQRLFADAFRQHNLAAIFFPACMVAATPIGQDQTVTIAGATVPFATAVARNISPGSTAGLPGLVLPAGLTGAGPPVSIELDGPAGSDRAMLALGLAVEGALGPIPPPPGA
ncbi:MAG TPA: indoleacetamide hydrolase [Caulobacteraceae bacterium]|nr:indoleacetamide hydrolase [Caulobacteraceae bacterium]